MSVSESEENEVGKDEDWEDWEDDAGCQVPTRDILFHDKEHESTEACIRHCATQYGWDLHAMSKHWKFDIYESIRAVNWIRREVAKHRKSMSDADLVVRLRAPFEASCRPPFLDDDEFLQPYLPDDSLLPALSCESWNADRSEPSEGAHAPSGAGLSTDASNAPAGLDELEALKAENQSLRDRLERQEALIQAAKASLLDAPEAAVDNSDSDDEKHGVKMKRSEQNYFDSYGKIGIHHEMLSDKVRTEAYRDFLLNNPSIVKDKIVLDVGCGTGILCMFAAKGGAKHVYGIDMSDIIDDARQIVAENGFADKITLIKGKVEEVVLPVDKVDLIISEWMGYFLLYESMLDSVVFARDKWLAPGGACMPDRCIMYMSGIDDGGRVGWWQYVFKRRLDFWDDVYGFNMSPIKNKVRERRMTDPMVEHYEQKQVVTDAVLLKSIDCSTIQVAELEFKAPFRVTASSKCVCDALLSHFDVAFQQRCNHPVLFSTGPESAEQEGTHWKQTAFYLKHPVYLDAGDAIEGVVHLNRTKQNARHLDIVIEWAHVPASGPRKDTIHQVFELV